MILIMVWGQEDHHQETPDVFILPITKVTVLSEKSRTKCGLSLPTGNTTLNQKLL